MEKQPKMSSRYKERLEALRIRAEVAIEMARHFHVDEKEAFSLSNQILLCSQINDVLQDYDPQALKELVVAKPEQFFRLAAAVNAQAAESHRYEKIQLELKKYRDQVAEQKRKIQVVLGQNQAQGLTPEVLAQIEEAARLL
jgi:hypothetical protein